MRSMTFQASDRWKLHSVAQSRPFNLLVFQFRSIFSHGPKRLTFYFWVLWASEFTPPCRLGLDQKVRDTCKDHSATYQNRYIFTFATERKREITHGHFGAEGNIDQPPGDLQTGWVNQARVQFHWNLPFKPPDSPLQNPQRKMTLGSAMVSCIVWLVYPYVISSSTVY